MTLRTPRNGMRETSGRPGSLWAAGSGGSREVERGRGRRSDELLERRGRRSGGGDRTCRGRVARAARGGRTNVLLGDASADARAADLVDVHAQVTGQTAHRGGRQSLAGLGGDARRGALHGADNGARVLSALGNFVGDLGLGRLGVRAVVDMLGCGLVGGLRGGAGLVGVGHQRVAHLQDLAGLAVEAGDRAGPGARDLDQRLVGLHLCEQIVLVDLLSDLHLPGDQLGLVHTLAQVGKDEVVGIAGGLARMRHWSGLDVEWTGVFGGWSPSHPGEQAYRVRATRQSTAARYPTSPAGTLRA